MNASFSIVIKNCYNLANILAKSKGRVYNKRAMKKFSGITAVAASAFLSACFIAGCAESVSVEHGDIMLDNDVAPTLEASYAQYTQAAVDEYFAVAESHLTEDNEIDYENPEVIETGKDVAAKLFAYACYNERQLDQYVFFATQEGDTDISAGSATALKQEYYLRINETDKTCGYRYHYTIKYVSKIEGTISMFRDAFESARTRITDKTDLLYRLEGSNIHLGEKSELFGVEILGCNWETGSDWGEPDIRMVKADYIEPEKIAEDIEAVAGEENITMRANINILAEDIVESGIIIKDESEENGLEGYIVFLSVDTDVANRDPASLKMLRKANGSDNCEWVGDEETSGLSIVFRIWKNGLFRMYSVSEKWKGKISGFAGTADSSTQYYYSYSDRDCDMSTYLEMLEAAKKNKG